MVKSAPVEIPVQPESIVSSRCIESTFRQGLTQKVRDLSSDAPAPARSAASGLNKTPFKMPLSEVNRYLAAAPKVDKNERQLRKERLAEILRAKQEAGSQSTY